MEKSIYTPDPITEISEDDILVFGNNSSGTAETTFAVLAREKFGAEEANPRGVQGHSYSIQVEGVSLDDIKEQINQFYEIASEWDQNTFLITDLAVVPGCLPTNLVAPLFQPFLQLYNIRLPKSYVEIINRNM